MLDALNVIKSVRLTGLQYVTDDSTIVPSASRPGAALFLGFPFYSQGQGESQLFELHVASRPTEVTRFYAGPAITRGGVVAGPTVGV